MTYEVSHTTNILSVIYILFTVIIRAKIFTIFIKVTNSFVALDILVLRL